MSTSQTQIVDLCIIGGGINGVGIAKQASEQGLSVCLLEQGDFACGTSSASTKLIHGGLRYLEYYEFRLVHEALNERETLLGLAPHLIWPLTFVIPHSRRLRPAWMIRLGLWLYDCLGKRQKLARSSKLNLSTHQAGTPLLDKYKFGFSYADCWVDDARLVISNAISARNHGATLLRDHEVLSACEQNGQWIVTAFDKQQKQTITVQAKALINACGPWLNQVKDKISGHPTDKITLIKGSHIIVPALYSNPEAYLLQNDDGRIIFTIPYEEKFTLIGTTDIPYTGAPSEVAITEMEVDYLCHIVNLYFKTKINAQDIVASYAGVRPLKQDDTNDPKAISRDYDVQLSHHQGAPLVVIYGGKLTTYRKLAAHVCELLAATFPTLALPYQPSPLAGSFEEASIADYQQSLKHRYPWCDEALLSRFARSYGTLCEKILEGKQSMIDLGEHYGGGLTQAECNYLREFEWARAPHDILLRRTKCGLHGATL